MGFGLVIAIAAVATAQQPAGSQNAASDVSQDRATDIDTRPLPLGVEIAFPNVNWPGWESPEESGRSVDFRPILLTHAGDQSNRVFVPTQRGVIYVFANDQETTQAEVFLDLKSIVSYSPRMNEEGFLGMAFHPDYASNGEFFVYYTNKHRPHQNVIARYRVSQDNPNIADPNSEEILLVLDKPFWNHDGGTLGFGPDGFLYIAVGDGGAANDPHKHGQNLSTLLGTILRIDVDNKQEGLAYAIPADNPFVDVADARGEIWAYGLRNVWRFAFDAETGLLWAGDVGQDEWEEIDLIVKGGNYGWNVREGLHHFVPKRRRRPAQEPKKPEGMIDPIWEYHHDIGKSITGGFVYRGKNIPELQGAYLYADYVSGQIWALWYDTDSQQVTANREIPLPESIPVMSFGEDEQGEAYFTTFSLEGQGIYRLTPRQ
ncbi:MAG: PQQ-dependent sugar dehydrogenase [Pirellulales bacterium]|nr:PQQ-dependent sugar dehydrogenase [Pirellulales bacterium]